MKKGLLFFTFIALMVKGSAQSNVLKFKIIDSVLQKTSKFLSLDKELSACRGIRIIDITNKIGANVGGYYNKIPILIKKKIPLNLNNGEYRDIIFYSFLNSKGTITITAILCNYEPNIVGIHIPLKIDFKFEVQKNDIKSINYNIEDLDEWAGYF